MLNRHTKTTILLLLYLLLSHIGKTQDTVEKINSVKLSILIPSLVYSYENKIGANSTLEVQAGIVGGFRYHSFNDYYSETNYSLVPIVDIGYKKYYNFNKRINKGKNTKDNAANFYGISVLNMFGEYTMGHVRFDGKKHKEHTFTSGYQIAIIPKWGFNRKLGNKISYSLQVGPSLITDLADVRLQLYTQIGFNYIFK